MSNKIRSIKKERERRQAEGITVTLRDLLDSQVSLKALCQQRLPIRKSYELGKIAKGVNSELTDYQSAHKTLCERYANKDEHGPIMLNAKGERVGYEPKARYDIPKDKQEEFNSELDSLLAAEVSIPGAQLKISELGEISIEPAHVIALDWLLTEDGQKALRRDEGTDAPSVD